MKSFHPLHDFRVLVLLITFYAGSVCGVPVNPSDYILTQSDGSSFTANMWGDEWAHGWETKNGYTIATNPLNSDWYYAALDCNGRLIASSVIVSDGMAEGVTYANGELIPKHLREEIRACDASPKPIPALSDLGLVLLSIMVFVAPFGALANRLQTGRG